METILPCQNQGEDRSTREALLDRARWRWCLYDGGALHTALLWPDNLGHLEGDGLHFQDLGLILTELLQDAAAVRAGADLWIKHLGNTFEMLGQFLAAYRLALASLGGPQSRGCLSLPLGLSNRGPQLLEGHRQLSGTLEPLGRLPESRPA